MQIDKHQFRSPPAVLFSAAQKAVVTWARQLCTQTQHWF